MPEPITTTPATTPKTDATATPEVKTADTQEEKTLLGGDVTTKAEAKATDSEVKTEGQETDDVIPESYDIKAPEGTTIDKVALEKITPVFKELGLSNTEAQKLIEASAPIIKSQVEAALKESMDFFNKTKEEWKTASIKELGPDKEQKLAQCAKVRDKFGDDDLKALFDETGIGNHPAIIRMFMKIGAVVNEDTLIDGKTKQTTGEKTLGQSLYATVDKK